jgi:DNA-binding SARP family transcriptional activator
MEFRILGPLEVADRHSAISFDAPKQRTLLAVLLLHANEIVSSERLVDELWGERPPATAPKVVQNYVSQLRRALGPDVILTRSPGYMLQIDEEALDAVRFRHLTTEARALAANDEPARAGALYREALALWRGPPLADVVFESFARNEVEALEEERLRALLDRIDCDLALRRQDGVVAELEMLVGQYPFRERLRGQLMLALYRCGRQADALAEYQNARRTLVDELGLEPNGELQALERAILMHDAALEPPPRAVRARPMRRRVLSWRAVAVGIPILVAVASGLAFALGGGEPAPRLLEPNSVGFIDSRSHRVTKSYPVGREPSALAVADDSLWVANYRDETVTRIDRSTGESHDIAVGGHPTGLAEDQGTIWVWTLERQLVPIRFERAGNSGSLGRKIAHLAAQTRGITPDAPRRLESGGKLISGGGFLWVTVPPTTVIRVSLTGPARAKAILPDDGVRAAVAYRNGDAWVVGFTEVFPIEASTGFPGVGTDVGHGRDLAFGAGSLWVVSGSDVNQRVGAGLRRVDLHGRVVDAKIDVGSDPVAVASEGGSIWVASRSDRSIRRVDPAKNRVVKIIALGAPPAALAADRDGVWVAVW